MSKSKVTKRMERDYAALYYSSPKPARGKRAKRTKGELAALRKTADNASHPLRTQALDALRDTRGVTPKAFARFVGK